VNTAARILAAIAVLAGLTAAGFAAFALAAPIVSGDLFWHLSCGRWMLEHHALLGLDPFSHTANDRPAELQEYGSQLVLAGVESLVGLAGLRWFALLLGVLLLVVVYRTARRRLPLHWAALLTALFVALYAYKWELRPQLFSAFIFLRLAHVLFERTRGAAPAPSRRALIETFLLCVLWVQLHAEALFGPMLAATGVIGAVCAALFERKERASVALRRIGRWTLAFVAALAGTFVSPLGLEPHLYVLRDSSVARVNVEEWQPLLVDQNGPRAFPLTFDFQLFVWAAALVAAVLLVRLALRLLAGRGDAHTPHWERFGFLCLCLVLAFLARRYFWLLWFVLLEAAALWHTRAALAPSVRRTAIVTASSVAVAAIALFVTARTLVIDTARFALREGRYTEAVDSALFPVHATRFAREVGLDGNLFHPYSWGGFLGAELWPAARVFVDGRTILFGEVIPIRQRIEREPDFARSELESRGVDVIVFQRVVNHGDGPQLWRPPGGDEVWLRAWSDRVAVVWVRRARADLVERVVSWYTEQGILFDAKRGFVEFAVLEKRPQWLTERHLVVEEIARELAGPLSRIGDGHGGARAWVELGRAALRWSLERSARHAFEAAQRALGRTPDMDAYERVGAQRAFALLDEELRALARDGRGGAR
jgi:hypothetical protein